MISILIPVYNYNVFGLVKELCKQIDDLQEHCEILVYDDFSEEHFKNENRKINDFKKVTYKELDKNFGRIAIRNMLANDAKYKWLLFIDADSSIINASYLNNYIKAIETQHDVYVGGTRYLTQTPVNCSKRLHWTYGTKREAVQRKRTALHVNNFCIRKDLFIQLKFPQWQGYGHEDTWMHLELEKRHSKILFINNPVQHDGLEDSILFLQKTKSALKNLLLLSKLVDTKQLQRRSNLFKLFYLQKKLRLTFLTSLVLKKRIEKIEANLYSCRPSLLQFDLYRLYFMNEIAKQNQI